ncbi:tRNA (adenine22-N1)-methyltransferase [Melghirimyces profundicolus]|uniref:tRNA (Adenine22-N1)-methyltransferase n=1 Tax=Melghirimyces profundicolus TaxID=1242148 RepID=A0A2T6C974_9BACL|nr:class I SAM-dependent methyltransferase [Melghirimyces profundicolus]PTX64888.1 tRNA (adenine22-N1)-methyltransferase [Melghirimyces profundicolus]
MENRVSARISALADRILPGRTVADIGSDHAQLLVTLAERGALKKGIAGELNRGPYQNAADRIREAGWTESIEVRQGDGLEVLQPGEAEVIVLAGMGGVLITSILSRGKEKLSGTEQLVLQPNNNGDRVRKWLKDHGWEIVEEELLKEGGILYEIISARRGESERPYKNLPLRPELLFRLGPLLCRDRHPLLRERVREEAAALKRILNSLRSARTPEAKEKQAEVAARLETWKEAELWLSRETS